jgi:hypothetical protein
MLIDSVNLKKAMEGFKASSAEDIVDKAFNLGVSSSIRIVELFEKDAKRQKKEGK